MTFSPPVMAAPPQPPPEAQARSVRRISGPTGWSLLLGAAATLICAIGLGRPAPWIDESVTVLAVRRSWPDLGRFILHFDAPLGLYYTMLKPWAAFSSSIFWLRIPSAIAAVVTVTLLTAWVGRHFSLPVGVAAGALLLALPTFSRFAQEARPYAAVMALGVACTVLWWRTCHDGGIPTRMAYGVTVMVLPLLHLLALAVVAVQLAAMLPFGRRIRLRVLGWAGVPLLLASPAFWFINEKAHGVAHPRTMSWPHLWLTFTEVFGSDAILELVLVLAALGVVRTLCTKDAVRRHLLLYALGWGLSTPVIVAITAAAGQKTLVARYMLVSLPGWAIVAGEGILAIAWCLSFLTRPLCPPLSVPRQRTAPQDADTEAAGTGSGTGRSSATRRPFRSVGLVWTAVSIVTAVLVIAQLGWSDQVLERTKAGHGQGDPSALLTELRLPADRGVAVFTPGTVSELNIRADAPDLANRMPLYQSPDRSGRVMRAPRSGAKAVAALRPYDQLAVLMFAGAEDLKKLVLSMKGLADFTIDEIQSSHGWSMVLMHRVRWTA